MGGNDAEIQHFVRICYSNYGTYFCWSIYIIEGALLTFGAFLAWESRNVSNLTKKLVQILEDYLLTYCSFKDA